MALLENESNAVKQVAAAALSQTGKKAVDAVPVLAAGVENPDPGVRAAFLTALAAIGPDAEEGLPAVITALADPVYNVRTSACYAVGKIGPAARVTIPLLEQHLQDRDPILRFAAAWALVQVDSKRADLGALCTEPIRLGLRSTEPRIRKDAAQALGIVGPGAANAIADLQALTKDSDEAVQQASTEALQKIQKEKPGSPGIINRIRGGRSEK
jgi:HEAT repeat protein